MINDYKVIEADKLDHLVKLVKDAMNMGWKPFGGICESGTEGLLFFQAMVKYV